ncbi:hypothetical protein P1X15_26960 [Runella sp. MFBS21]|uniref:DUF6973 domain-containing protein n=1 Tax=Runella sp. MFBS21 TaxID=3034018 RepID=UPI0023F66417|nr:hypothetical protein [Runella sp. MFBS21]MDF7821293.1 hypothetical protein [Runella sp. MFBS21]
MKKNRLRHLSNALFIILLTGVSCSRELLITPLTSIGETTSDEVTIERAKVIYENSLQTNKISSKARKKAREESPDWERAKKLKFKGGRKALVVPVFEMPESITLTKIDAEPDKGKLNLSELVTPLQLVLYKDEKGTEILERMYSKADPTYQKRKKNKSEDRDFTGMHWFEDNEGNFKRGFVYEDGNLIKTLLPKVSGGKANLRTTCQTTTYTTTINYYSVACVTGYGCGDPVYMYSETYSYTVSTGDCQSKHDIDYSPYDNGGGGGWGSSTTNEDPLEEGWAVPEDKITAFLQWLGSLNEAEAKWAKANPTKVAAAWGNKKLAESTAQSLFMCEKNGVQYLDIDGTNQNAFKHAYWNALNFRSFGSSEAKIIGDNHESEDMFSLDAQMDLWNNQLGRKVAETCGCGGVLLRQKVLEAIYNKQGKRLSIGTSGVKKGSLIPTSSATSFCNDN